jgi:type VI secretion system protein VasD
MLTLVQLRDRRQFESEDFIELYQDPKTRLSGDFISASTLREFLPGESREEEVVLTPEVRYVGLIAAYSQYRKAVTKLVLPIEPHSSNDFTININELGISLR